MVECFLNTKKTAALWDTGAQVSVISKTSLDEIIPNAHVKDIAELLDTKLSLSAANGTSIPYMGWVELEFDLKHPSEKKILVPFLVTNDTNKNIIIGYNVIEHFVKESDNSTASACEIAKAFTGAKTSSVETLVSFMRSSNHGNLCQVKTMKKDVLVRKGQSTKISCRANTGPVCQRTPVLFEPIFTDLLPDGLSVSETLLSVDKGKSSVKTYRSPITPTMTSPSKGEH